MIVSIVGPGDPMHHGGPSRHVVRWILDHTATMGSGRYWKDRGTWKKLNSPDDFRALNAALDGVRSAGVL